MPQTQRKANQQTRLDQASMGTALVAAAEAGSPRLLEILLAGKPSDEQLIAAARTCIQRERVDFLQLVLRAGADLTSFPAFHHLAHLAGQIKSVKSANAILRVLKQAGADIDARGTTTMTPLIAAAYAGNLIGAKALIANGADIEKSTDSGYGPGGTALILAVLFGHPHIVRLLLAKGARLEARTANGETALMCAASSQAGTACIELLLAAGADPHAANQSGDSAAVVAVEHHQSDCLRALIWGGIDINQIRKRDGRTLLEAAFEHHVQFCGPNPGACGELLLHAGAAIPAKIRRPGSRRKSPQIPFAELLREHGYQAALSLLNAMKEAHDLSKDVPTPASLRRSIAL